MKRLSRHIALISAATLIVATVGLPMAVVYCSMQKTVMTDGCCCTHEAPAHAGARIGSASCMTITEIGRPLTTSFEKVASYFAAPLVPLFALVEAPSPVDAGVSAQTSVDDSSPPPLAQSSILLI